MPLPLSNLVDAPSATQSIAHACRLILTETALLLLRHPRLPRRQQPDLNRHHLLLAIPAATTRTMMATEISCPSVAASVHPLRLSRINALLSPPVPEPISPPPQVQPPRPHPQPRALPLLLSNARPPLDLTLLDLLQPWTSMMMTTISKWSIAHDQRRDQPQMHLHPPLRRPLEFLPRLQPTDPVPAAPMLTRQQHPRRCFDAWRPAPRPLPRTCFLQITFALSTPLLDSFTCLSRRFAPSVLRAAMSASTFASSLTLTQPAVSRLTASKALTPPTSCLPKSWRPHQWLISTSDRSSTSTTCRGTKYSTIAHASPSPFPTCRPSCMASAILPTSRCTRLSRPTAHLGTPSARGSSSSCCLGFCCSYRRDLASGGPSRLL